MHTYIHIYTQLYIYIYICVHYTYIYIYRGHVCSGCRCCKGVLELPWLAWLTCCKAVRPRLPAQPAHPGLAACLHARLPACPPGPACPVALLPPAGPLRRNSILRYSLQRNVDSKFRRKKKKLCLRELTARVRTPRASAGAGHPRSGPGGASCWPGWGGGVQTESRFSGESDPHLSIYLSIYPSIHLSIYLEFRNYPPPPPLQSPLYELFLGPIRQMSMHHPRKCVIPRR